jgi:hypothetical protein
MKSFYSQLKLEFGFVTGPQNLTSKQSPESAVRFNRWMIFAILALIFCCLLSSKWTAKTQRIMPRLKKFFTVKLTSHLFFWPQVAEASHLAPHGVPASPMPRALSSAKINEMNLDQQQANNHYAGAPNLDIPGGNVGLGELSTLFSISMFTRISGNSLTFTSTNQQSLKTNLSLL